ncbi:pantoate--beta-alanine ligase [Phenylobacterium sp.]|uniref:pantoate--beta-alanine ligase n=1 Tax=Phenylobacterium sp. TaxID=1871053 RepID=UPI002721C6C3|nr:pantoate--beta-alanine ligase [Phenylobacterium sp.]MDO8799577.1 pantoate--beta-alanine ligase [Phenylobacterium sp.]
MPLTIVRTVADLRAQVATWRKAGETVGLVPTMGALHSGHLSLVTLAKTKARRVVASVFVNPTQFAPHEDFDAYPRDEAKDADLLESAGCDLMFAPTVAEMYAPGFSTTVTVSGVSGPLDGAARPGHFAGVATVVSKLLLQCGPDVAVFGEKDYQQLQVIKRLVADLDIPVQVIGAPTARAQDGLALSSRNAYLTPAEREAAPSLAAALRDAVERLRDGVAVDRVENTGRAALERAGFSRIDYFEVRDASSLEPLGPGPITGPARILAAGILGKTRLIDNMAV